MLSALPIIFFAPAWIRVYISDPPFPPPRIRGRCGGSQSESHNAQSASTPSQVRCLLDAATILMAFVGFI